MIMWKCVFHEKWFGSSCWSQSNFRTVSSNIPNFSVIFRELLHTCCFTAIYGVFMAGVHRDRGQPVSTSAWGVTLHIPYRCWYNHWKTLAVSVRTMFHKPPSISTSFSVTGTRVETMLKDSFSFIHSYFISQIPYTGVYPMDVGIVNKLAL